MGQLTEDLLWLARADNRPAKPLEPCSLKDILGDLEEELAPLALAKNVTVTCQLPEPDLKVIGDPAQLYRLFINLITNAIKYTAPAGNVKITLSFTNRALVEIQDSGIGIAPEHLPHLFERFYRVDEARTASGGTGLGLAIARTICETHGGEITVQSTLGQGSLFRVSLPLGEGDDGNFCTFGDRSHPRL
jgi:signal transduction histidine kinase